MSGVDLISGFYNSDFAKDLFIHILFYVVCMCSFFSLGIIFALYAVGYMAANATREDMEDIYFLKFSDGDSPFYSIKHPTDMFIVVFMFFRLKFQERFFKKKRHLNSSVTIRRTKVNKRISVATVSIITIFSMVAAFHFVDSVKAEKARHILKAETIHRQKTEIVRNSPKMEQDRKLPKTKSVHSSPKTETVDNLPEKPIVHNSQETEPPRNFPKKENRENVDNLQEKEIVRGLPKTEPVPSKTEPARSLTEKDPVYDLSKKEPTCTDLIRTLLDRTLLNRLLPKTEPIVPMR